MWRLARKSTNGTGVVKRTAGAPETSTGKRHELRVRAGCVHRPIGREGGLVSNDRGDELYVGGDGTLLNENVAGSLGVWLTSEAARLSRQAIQDLLHHGRTAITVDEIFGYVPQYIWAPRPEGETMAAPGPGAPTWQKKSLAEWHDEDLHSTCMAVIFPQVASSFINLVGARVVQQHLVHGLPSRFRHSRGPDSAFVRWHRPAET